VDDVTRGFLRAGSILADVDDSFDAHASSAEQTEALLAAGLSFGIRALGTGMEFIFAQNFAVPLYPCDSPAAVKALGRDFTLFS